MSVDLTTQVEDDKITSKFWDLSVNLSISMRVSSPVQISYGACMITASKFSLNAADSSFLKDRITQVLEFVGIK